MDGCVYVCMYVSVGGWVNGLMDRRDGEGERDGGRGR